MSLERDGMPDDSLQCEHGIPCIYTELFNPRTGEERERECGYLRKQRLDFGDGSFPVCWCQWDVDEYGEVHLMTIEEARRFTR